MFQWTLQEALAKWSTSSSLLVTTAHKSRKFQVLKLEVPSTMSKPFNSTMVELSPSALAMAKVYDGVATMVSKTATAQYVAVYECRDQVINEALASASNTSVFPREK
jgi:hypothetical protein